MCGTTARLLKTLNESNSDKASLVFQSDHMHLSAVKTKNGQHVIKMKPDRIVISLSKK